MLSRNPRPVAEHEAHGDTARIYHEIRQTLRVSGINLNFRTWAAFRHFFPAMWRAMQPIAASQAFESTSDALRARAVDVTSALPPMRVGAAIGESQRYQLQRALDLYHYINPKLLLFTAVVRRGLLGTRSASGASHDVDFVTRIAFGAPPTMAAMEMVDENPDDRRLRRIFRDIQATLDLPSINSDYRTLAMWPDYLEPAWARLKPVVSTEPYRHATNTLARDAVMAAERFPVPAGIDLRRLKLRGENTSALRDATDQFERLLPSLIVNIALLSLDWHSDAELRRSPFPGTGTAINMQRGT